MKDPVGELKAQLQEQKPKVLFAAGLAGVLLVLSLTVAGGTLYFILRGDPGTPARNSLPSDCDWVVESHPGTDPRELLRRLAAVPLPHPASALLATAIEQTERIGEGVDVPAGLAVCDRGATLLWSIGLRSAGDLGPARAIAEQGRGGEWIATAPVGGFTELWLRREGRKVAAILHTDRRALFAVVSGSADADTELARAVAAARKQSLRDAPGFREGAERVGGLLRVWMSKAVTERWFRRPWLEYATWYAASVRDEGGEPVVYLHVGGGQRLFDAARRAIGERGERRTDDGVMIRWAVVHTGVGVELRPGGLPRRT